MTSKKVGGEVDAFCGQCKLTLAHTIIAMVGSRVARVQCNTCGTQHAMRGTSPPAKRKPKAASAPSPKSTKTWADLVGGHDIASAIRYAPEGTFAPDQVLHHPSFGLGAVISSRPDKVEVLFQAGMKTLVHGRKAAGPKPVYHPPSTQGAWAADKPPSEAEAPAPPPAPPEDEAEQEE